MSKKMIEMLNLTDSILERRLYDATLVNKKKFDDRVQKAHCSQTPYNREIKFLNLPKWFFISEPVNQ